MKKTTLLIIALFAFIMTWAQPNQQNNREEFSKFYNEIIKPELKNAQNDFFNVLTEKEKKDLKVLSEQRDKLILNSQDRKQGNRSSVRDEMMKLRGKAEVIADAHPDQSEDYRDLILDKIPEWETEIPNRNQPQGRGNRMKNQTGNKNQMLNQMSDPSWILLWNPNRTPQMMLNFARGGNMNNQRGQGQQVGGRGQRANENQGGRPMNGNMGQNKQMYANRGYSNTANSLMNNPQFRSDIQDYALENILTVVAEQRIIFDEKLSNEEKEKIELARGKIKARQEMYKSMSERDDFKPGEGRNDPNFDNLRTDMQNSMQEIRQIALDHSGEINSIQENYKLQSDKWILDIQNIMQQNNVDNANAENMFLTEFRKNTTPILFLIFDPENIENSKLFGINKM